MAWTHCRIVVATVAAVVGVGLVACSATPGPETPSPTVSSSPSTAAPKATDLSITWLAVAGSEGSTGTTVISRKEPAEKGDFRVEFSENEVGGIGSQSQAGAWNAAIISTLLLGQPLEGEFRFETDGRIDGPSAGALTTAGLIAVARGDEFLDNVTMTGTINATGTIGPVGGIPEKVGAAADAGITKVLIPLGQRMTPDHKGKLVDVIKAGERDGVEVVEVGDIYEAYGLLTGVNIDLPGVSRDPRLDSASYDKVKPQADIAMARYSSAKKDFDRLPDEIQQVFIEAGLIDLVKDYANKAEDLQRQGLQAGAYNLASQAASALEAVVATGELTVPLYTKGLAGLDVLFEQALDSSTAEREFFAFLDRLSTYSPKNVADAEGLINAYSGAFDAYSLVLFSQTSIETIQARYEADDYSSLDEFFSALVTPVLWSQLARSQLTSTSAVFEAGRDNPGAAFSDEIDLEQVGHFFGRGADANLTAFTENVVAPLADSRGVSTEQMLAALSNVDISIAAAVTQQQVQPGIADYIGEGKPNAAYATLGYGLMNYVRNQSLVDKYYNNAVLDDNLAVVDVEYDAVLGHALDLGKQQVAAEIGRLREGGTEPVLSVAGYEVAGLLRGGDVLEQFQAVTQYNSVFLITRTMSYLSGDPGGTIE